MGVEIPVGYGQATFVLQCAGSPKPAVWTLGFKDDLFSSAGESAAAIREDFTGSGKLYAVGNMSSSWSFLGVRVTYVNEGGIFTGEDMVTVVGTASIPPIPINCAILVKKNTAKGGRKHRGRMYLPPVSPTESNVDAAGFIGSGDVGGIQANLDASLAAMALNPMTPYLLHSDGSLPTEITSFSVQSRIATQRRRMR